MLVAASVGRRDGDDGDPAAAAAAAIPSGLFRFRHRRRRSRRSELVSFIASYTTTSRVAMAMAVQ